MRAAGASASQVLWQQKLALLWRKSVNVRDAFRDSELRYLIFSLSVQPFRSQPFTEENLFGGSPSQNTPMIL